MSKFYRVAKGCRHCESRDAESLSADEVTAWQCPWNDPECKGQLTQVSWLWIHRKKLILSGIICAFLSLIVYLTIPGEREQIGRNLEKIQSEASETLKTIQRFPQNPGTEAPEYRIWQTRLGRAKQFLDTTPQETEERDLSALQELKNRLAEQIEHATSMKAPPSKSIPPFKGYSDARNELQSSERRLSRNTREARKQNFTSLVARGDEIQRILKSAKEQLRKKSTPPKHSSSPPQQSLEEYKNSLVGAITRTEEAIEKEKERIEKQRLLEAEAERRRKKEQLQRTREEQERLWSEARPQLILITPKSLLESLTLPVCRAFLTQDNAAPDELRKTDRIRLKSATGKTIEIAMEDSTDLAATVPRLLMVASLPGKNISKGNVIALDALVFSDNTTRKPSPIDMKEAEVYLDGLSTTIPSANSPSLVIPESGRIGSHVIPPNLLNAKHRANGGQETQADRLNQIRITSFSENNSANFVPIQQVLGSAPITPSRSTIASETYRFTNRIILQGSSSPLGDALIEFHHSRTGHQKLSELGFIALDVRISNSALNKIPEYVKNAFPSMQIIGARKLSSDFRFNTDDSELDLRARDDLKRIAPAINGLEGIRLAIGFADARGPEDYNLKLSKKRAQHVTGQLESSNANLRSVKVSFEGEKFPVADDSSAASLALNRRVEIWIVEVE